MPWIPRHNSDKCEKKKEEDKPAPKPLNEKELQELSTGIMKHPALELFADDNKRQKIIFGDIKRPTEFDKFIVQETDNTEVFVKSEIAFLARESAYIGRHLERWVEEKIVPENDIAKWYKQVQLAFTWRLMAIQSSYEEVVGTLTRRLPNLKDDFKAGYEKMVEVARQCDIGRTKWFGALPIKPIEDFKSAAEKFHKIIYAIHTEAIVELDKLTKPASSGKIDTLIEESRGHHKKTDAAEENRAIDNAALHNKHDTHDIENKEQHANSDKLAKKGVRWTVIFGIIGVIVTIVLTFIAVYWSDILKLLRQIK